MKDRQLCKVSLNPPFGNWQDELRMHIGVTSRVKSWCIRVKTTFSS